MSGSGHWRPYGKRAEVIRWFLPDIQWTLKLPGGLKVRASAKKHLGLFRRRARRREVAVAETLASYVPTDGVIYDLGANIGVYTVVFASNPRRSVVSFEPSQTARPYLDQSIALNALRNVEVHQIVLSDYAGTCRFTLDRITTATSHVSAPDEAGIDLPCTDLDSYIEARHLRAPDLIKMDVEGHDEAILRGMRRSLLRFKPLVYLEGGLRADDGEIGAITYLERMGYSIWDLHRQRRLTADTPEYSFLAMPGRETSDIDKDAPQL